MRRFVVTLMASLLSCSTVFAFWPEAADSSLEVGVGYRQDRLQFKTSSHFDSSYSGNYEDYGYDGYGLPDGIESHVKWRKLEIWQIQAAGKYVTCDNIYLRACGDYGWITHGKNTDSDYVNVGAGYGSGSGSENEFAHSRSRARGHVYDAKLAAGYQFKMCDNSFSIAPLVGYSWHGQHIKDRHLKQSFYVDDTTITVYDNAGYDDSYSDSSSSYSDYFESYGSSSGHKNNSSYHTRWNGPFIGFDLDYQFGCFCDWELQFFGGYEFHWARFHARGNWNLREDLAHGFQHRAKNAYGHVFDIGVRWDFCECWTLALKGEFQWWHAKKGHDRSKIAEHHVGDVETNCYLKIPLRDVKWHSAAVTVDLGMAF